MSLDPILWAMKDAPVADVEEWAVLVCMAEHAHEDGSSSMPSVPTMARRTKLSERCVRTRLVALEERRLIGRGDQSVADVYPADRRPVVWDLLIPLYWFPNLSRVIESRASRGLGPLTEADRPPIVDPPVKRRRRDFGVPKKPRDGGGDDGGNGFDVTTSPVVNGDGVTDSPVDDVTTSPVVEHDDVTTSHAEDLLDDVDGVTTSPERGDYKSRTGCTAVTQTSPTNLPKEPPHGSAAKPRRAGSTKTAALSEAETAARGVVKRYVDWVKEQNGGRVFDSSRMFNALVKAFVTPAIEDGWTELEVRGALHDSFREGHEIPSKDAWRRYLSGRRATITRTEAPRAGSGVWGNNVTTMREAAS